MSLPTPPPLMQGMQEAPQETTLAQSLVPSKTQQEVTLWTQERLQLLKKTITTDLTDTEFSLFIEVCKRRRLDPFTRQIHAVKRGGKLVIQTAIDGYRLIADRTGKYVGQMGPMWCGPDGIWKDIWTETFPPFAAKVGALRADFVQPMWGVAYWAMYVAPGPFWSKAGASQLAKCAEALALRKAFPEELSGIYTDDEMSQADPQVIDIVPEPESPVMIFPKETVQSWIGADNLTYALVKDNEGREWLFSGAMIEKVDTALTQSSAMVVNFVVDTGRKVVTEIVS